MRKKIVIGLGATTAVIALSTGISGALAASVGHEQAHAVTAAAHTKITKAEITKAEARQIAKAKVPHSHVIEIESDDRHDRAVWKVTLATPQGRVIVDVDKKTGKATIVHHGGGHGDGASARALSGHRSSGSDSARDAREDRGEHRRDASEDRRDHDGRQHRGDRHDGDRHDGDRHRSDRRDHDGADN